MHGPAAEKEWSVDKRKWVLVAAMLAMVASMSGGVRGQGGAPVPILVVLNDLAPNPFGRYLPEILRAEGVNSFEVVQLSAIDAPTLGAASLVVLAETPLTAPEATLFIDYVTAGGRLVAMRPDPQLHDALGIAAAAGTTTNGYVLVDQGGPGAGLQNLTLPFRGVADHYDLDGATSIAELYTTRTLSAGRPVVARQARTAAWAFDLARSTAYTRQGDPTLAGVDRDLLPDPPLVRTNDVFYQAIDVERVAIPHADVQQRLFVRVIAELLADATPLPRLWYFPGASRTMLIPTGDSHTGATAPFAALIAAVENVGARISLYLARDLPQFTDNPFATWLANGHEVGMHPYFAADGFEGNFVQGYDVAEAWFQSLPLTPSATSRHHSIEWGGWVDPVSVMAARGIRMDLSYYSWGPALANPDVTSQAHGYLNGSGLPMRFVTASGQVLSVYQQYTALVDEQLLNVSGSYSENLSTNDALAVSRQLIDASQAGGYSAIATQFHVDYYQFGHVQPWVDGTLAYAAGQQIPMWTAQRWLSYTEDRAATAVSDVTWTPGTGVLTFSVAVPDGGEPQTVTLPTTFAGRTLSNLTLDGATVAPSLVMVNGRATQFFAVAPIGGGGARTVVASYALPASLPTVAVSDASVVETDAGTTTAGLTVTLSAAAATDVSVVWATSDGTATAGADYVAGGGTLTFAPGVTSLPISITVNGDVASEPNETVLVTLSNPIGATFGDAAGVVTILDDEPDPTDWTHTTAADFGTCSAVSGTRVGAPGDVRLLGTFRDDFDGGTLDPRWISGSWVNPPTPYTPTPAGGVLSLGNADGAYLRSAADLTATTFEARARFGASPFQVIGFSDSSFDTRYARFTTGSGGTNLYAATDPGSGAILTDLGPIPTGFRTFTIERVTQAPAELIRYRIDGALVAEHSVTAGDLPPTRYLFFSNNGGATPTLDVDTVEVDPPVAAAGTFDSCAIDALLSVVWNQLSWTATTPAGSSVQVRTRSSLDGVTWSAWSAPLTTSGSTITSPNGRYLQYRLELATADPAAAPIVHGDRAGAADDLHRQRHRRRRAVGERGVHRNAVLGQPADRERGLRHRWRDRHLGRRLHAGGRHRHVPPRRDHPDGQRGGVERRARRRRRDVHRDALGAGQRHDRNRRRHRHHHRRRRTAGGFDRRRRRPRGRRRHHRRGVPGQPVGAEREDRHGDLRHRRRHGHGRQRLRRGLRHGHLRPRPRRAERVGRRPRRVGRRSGRDVHGHAHGAGQRHCRQRRRSRHHQRRRRAADGGARELRHGVRHHAHGGGPRGARQRRRARRRRPRRGAGERRDARVVVARRRRRRQLHA